MQARGSVEVCKTPELRITDLIIFFSMLCFNQSYRQVRLNELLQEHSRAANLIVLWVASFDSKNNV